MRIFRRKQTDSGLPPEIQAYNQDVRRERVGMAWLVGIVSLLVTLLVVSGLFFGGRWVYRKITGNNSTSQPQDSSKQSDDQSKDGSGQAKDTDKNGRTDTGDGGNNRTDSPAEAPIPSPSPEAGTQPTTGDSSDSLFRTGPDIDL